MFRLCGGGGGGGEGGGVAVEKGHTYIHTQYHSS